MIVLVFVFVFFNSCCINLNYEWNSLLKKSFSFFKTYRKNRFDFSIVKNTFFYYNKTNLIFLLLKKKPFFFSSLEKHIWYFLNQKTSWLYDKHRSGFLSPKATFFYILQNKFGILTNQNQFFFTNQNRFDFFFLFLTEEEISVINKFVWFDFCFKCSTNHSWHA